MGIRISRFFFKNIGYKLAPVRPYALAPAKQGGWVEKPASAYAAPAGRPSAMRQGPKPKRQVSFAPTLVKPGSLYAELIKAQQIADALEKTPNMAPPAMEKDFYETVRVNANELNALMRRQAEADDLAATMLRHPDESKRSLFATAHNPMAYVGLPEDWWILSDERMARHAPLLARLETENNKMATLATDFASSAEARQLFRRSHAKAVTMYTLLNPTHAILFSPHDLETY